MEVADIERILNQTGQNFVQLRKECLSECANLFDTHEMTLAEKNCHRNCFKKLTYVKEHFKILATKELGKVNRLDDKMFTKSI